MKITLNEVEYIAENLKTGLWFSIQKLKTEFEKRNSELLEILEKVKPYENVQNLEEDTQKEIDDLWVLFYKKNDENTKFLLESKINILVKAINNKDVNRETILEHLLLKDVSDKFSELNILLNDILAGRVEQLPNE